MMAMRICRNCLIENDSFVCELCGATMLRHNAHIRDDAMPRKEPGCQNMWVKEHLKPGAYDYKDESEPIERPWIRPDDSELLPSDSLEYGMSFRQKIDSGYYAVYPEEADQ